MTDSRPNEAVATSELSGVKVVESTVDRQTGCIKGQKVHNYQKFMIHNSDLTSVGVFYPICVGCRIHVHDTVDFQQSAVLCFPLSCLFETRTQPPTPMGFPFLRWL